MDCRNSNMGCKNVSMTPERERERERERESIKTSEYDQEMSQPHTTDQRKRRHTRQMKRLTNFKFNYGCQFYGQGSVFHQLFIMLLLHNYE